MEIVTKKVKLTPEAYEKIKGSAQANQFKFNSSSNKYEKSMRMTRGLLLAWKKSPKFMLKLVAGVEKRTYLSKDNALTTNKKEAKLFAHGFDDPTLKRIEFMQRMKLVFEVENIVKLK
jgi:preprotein translocase subunit SecA